MTPATLLAEEAPDPLVLLDGEGRITAANPAATGLLGPDCAGRAIDACLARDGGAPVLEALAADAGTLSARTASGVALTVRFRRRSSGAGWALSAHPAIPVDVGAVVREHLAPAFKGLPVSLHVFDAQGRFAAFAGLHEDEGPNAGRWEGVDPFTALASRPELTRLRGALDGAPSLEATRSEQHETIAAIAPLRIDGRIAGAVSVSVDRTELRDSRETVDTLSTRMRELCTHAPVILCCTDSNGVCTLLEGAGLAEFGIAAGAFVGTSLLELLANQPHGSDLTLRTALAGQACHRTVTWGVHTFEVHLAPSLNVDGVVTGVVGVAVNASERIRAEAALRESEERYRLALAATRDAMWDLDLRTNRLVLSARWHESLGYAPGEIEPTLDAMRALVHPEDVHQVLEALALAKGPLVRIVELRMRHKSGVWRWVRTRSQTFLAPDGTAHRVIGVNTDITEARAFEEHLRFKNSILEAQLQGSPDAILIVDAANTMIRCNDRFPRMWNLTHEELRDVDTARLGVGGLLCDPHSLRRLVEHDAAHPSESSRGPLHRKDGRVIERYSSPILAADGTCYGRVITMRDMTEIERARARVERSERLLRTVLDTVPDVVAVRGPDGFDLVNAAGGALPGGTAVLQEMLDHALADGGPLGVEHALPLGGPERLYRVRQVAMTMADGTEARLVVASDITELRAEHAARLRSEAQFRGLIERLPDAVMIHAEGRILYANPAFVRAVGYADLAELMTLPSTSFVVPAQLEAVQARAALVLQGGPAQECAELGYVRKDGSTGIAESRTMLTEFDGRRALLVLARDITLRKRMEEQLALTERMASVGTLAAGVAHEINNPLSYVLTNTEYARSQLMAVRTPLPGEVLDALSDAIEGATRVRDIVRDLKSLSRSHEDDGRVGPVDVHQVVETALGMARTELRHRAQVVRELAPVPPVNANAGRLGQVLLNLLVNAAQAIPEGEKERNLVTVSTGVDGKGRVVIAVRDTGCGIPAALRSRIFDPFFTTKPVGVGTGLGLPISHNIVTSFGGELLVESEPGQGSCFSVVLPVAQGGAEHPAPMERAAEPPALRVLVVDDEPAMAASIRRLLGPGSTVSSAPNGRVALEMLRASPAFDLVLCDLMMPEMTGMDLYEAIERELPALAARFVFMTGGTFTERSGEFLRTSSRPALEKPMSGEVLRSTLASVLGPAA